MTPLDHAIANLRLLCECHNRAGDLVNAKKVLHELWGYQDVRDGVPRAKREMQIHHVEYLDLYRQARHDADLLAGVREKREGNP